MDCIDLSDSGSSSPIEDLQEIAQGVDSIEISDDSEEFLNVKANPGLNPNLARKEIHIIEGAEETELERILKKNEYYKRLKKNRENLDKPDGSLLPKPSTSKQEDIIGKNLENDNTGHVSTYPYL